MTELSDTRHAHPPTASSFPESRLQVSPGLSDLGERISFMGVEVPKGKGGPAAVLSSLNGRDPVPIISLPIIIRP